MGLLYGEKNASRTHSVFIFQRVIHSSSIIVNHSGGL